jgi:tyrosinase
MGARPTITGNNFARLNNTNPLSIWNVDGTGIRRRTRYQDTGFPSTSTTRNELAILALGGEFKNFRAMETNPHGHAHSESGNSGDWIPTLATAVKDPLFFLLHCNVDRQWAKWQWINNRFDLNINTYSLAGAFTPNSGTAHIGHYPLDTMWPWNGITGTYTGTGTISRNQRPTTAPGGTFPDAISFSNSPVATPQVQHMIDYKNNRAILTVNSGLGFSYDEIPFE